MGRHRERSPFQSLYSHLTVALVGSPKRGCSNTPTDLLCSHEGMKEGWGASIGYGIGAGVCTCGVLINFLHSTALFERLEAAST
jgi:hypothetical protein